MIVLTLPPFAWQALVPERKFSLSPLAAHKNIRQPPSGVKRTPPGPVYRITLFPSVT